MRPQFNLNRSNPHAADLLEIYAPLFTAFDGKAQVLQPHCVGVSGANDCNLFVNRSGDFVIPVTSRVRFLARRANYGDQAAIVTIRLPETQALNWAKVILADGPPYPVELKTLAEGIEIPLPHHQMASLVVAGKGTAPPLSSQVVAQERLTAVCDRLFPPGKTVAQFKTIRRHPELGKLKSGRIKVRGTHLGASGRVMVSVNEIPLGTMPEGENGFTWQVPASSLSSQPPAVTFSCGDEGTWFLVEAIDLLVQRQDGKWVYAASWTPPEPVVSSGKDAEWTHRLHWCEPEELAASMARFKGRDSKTAGAWKGRYGACAAWIANVNGLETQNGYRLQVDGTAFAWNSAASDPRALESPEAGAAGRLATCWFGNDALSCVLTPPDVKPYRLSLYVLDYDRNGRANCIQLSDEAGILDSCETSKSLFECAFPRRTQTGSKQENAQGTYISWTVAGPITVKLTKKGGSNVALSAVLIDPSVSKWEARPAFRYWNTHRGDVQGPDYLGKLS